MSAVDRHLRVFADGDTMLLTLLLMLLLTTKMAMMTPHPQYKLRGRVFGLCFEGMDSGG